MDLEHYSTGAYSPGAPFFKQLLWHFIGDPLVQSRLLPFSGLKVAVLRLFGASIGDGVRVKPGVRVKFPWRLTVGSFTWLGEDAWIDNLAEVRIGSHCCISQGAYLCTGDHDWTAPGFDLVPEPIFLADRVWLAAFSRAAPGFCAGEGAVLTMASLGVGTLEPWSVYAGVPAVKLRARVISDRPPEPSGHAR